MFYVFEMKINFFFLHRTIADKDAEIQELRAQLEEMKIHKVEESSSDKPRNINEVYRDRSKLKLLVKTWSFSET